MASAATPAPTSGVSRSSRRSTCGRRRQREPPDAERDERRDQPDDDGPAELRDIGRPGGGQVGQREGEGAEPGPALQADEDERADPRGQQTRQQHHAEHRPGHRGRLHQQERAQQRIAEQRGDRREASRRRDHRGGLGRGVPPGEAHRQSGQPRPERDQRRLRSQHRAEAEGGQRGQRDAGYLDRRRCGRPGMEPIGRRVPAPPGQVLDRRARPAGRTAPAAAAATTTAARRSPAARAGRCTATPAGPRPA